MVWFRGALQVFVTIAVVSFVAGPREAMGSSLAVANEAGRAGQTIVARLSVASEDDRVGGVNAHLILPPGVDVVDVVPGAAFPSNDFSVAFSQRGRDLYLVGFSSSSYVPENSAGAAFEIQMRIPHSLAPGLLPIDFAAQNLDPRINTRHAVSNEDGSVSLSHSISSGSLLVFDNDSDFDMDGMPDLWEIANSLDSLVFSALADTDGDGATDLQEYTAGSDPNDPSSVPGDAPLGSSVLKIILMLEEIEEIE